MINWHEIDTVLLDMDGTLLDLHYDNFFWTQHLPRRYVDFHGGELESVSKTLIDKIMAQRGSLNWYCLDYWSEELRLDITALKREISHLICMHPSTQRFLESLQESGREVWLVTNAHQGGLDIKLEKTGLGQWVQRIITSHELALPKEDDAFWQRLADHWHYEPSRSLLIDDTATVQAGMFEVQETVCVEDLLCHLAIHRDGVAVTQNGNPIGVVTPTSVVCTLSKGSEVKPDTTRQQEAG